MELPRWQRHWWEWAAQPLSAYPEEPKVWVDPSLYVEEPPPRVPRASGTIPPPTCIGPHSTLRERVSTEADTLVEPAEDLD
jgi:hypothetical protein